MKTTNSIFFLSLITLLFPFALPALANDNGDELSKYSYPIFTLANKQQYTGTAFFYRSGDTSYLVSNYHAIKGMSPVKQVINFSTDTLYLKYRVINSDEYKVMAIDISDKITGKTEIFNMVDRIDLMKLAVTVPGDADIFYINDLIDEDYLHKVPEEIVAFGYPTQPGSIPVFYSQQKPLRGRINPNGFTEYNSSLKLNFPDASDSARAIINASSRYYYFIKPYAAAGYSGAPVFGKYRDANDQTIYRFTGVIFAGQPATKQTWAIKGSVVLKYLEGEL